MTRRALPFSMPLFFCALLCAGALAGCGDGEAELGTVMADADASSDARPDTDASTSSPSDADASDASPDTASDASPDAASDTASDTRPADDTALAPDTSASDTVAPTSGALCASPCEGHDQCGGVEDRCVVNGTTGEAFCGQGCASTQDCPDRFACVEIGEHAQCVPHSGTCQGYVACESACGAGQVCRDGACVEAGPREVELQFCVDQINKYRVRGGLALLARSSALEDCAMAGALADSQTGMPHGHFASTSGCGFTARSENEIPGWPGGEPAVLETIELGTRVMHAEGPGGGHHDNIMSTTWTEVGCGVHVTAEGDIWVVQDFR